jgi:4-coumarate--CoA ligase
VIHRSPFPDVEIPESLLFDFLFEHNAARVDRVALVDGPTGRSYTYGELEGAIRSFAGGLAAAGFGPGDVMAIMSPNLPEYAVVFHGAALAGGTVTTINPTYTAGEVNHQLEDAGASILVTIPMFLETASMGAAGTGVKEIYVIGEVDGAASVTTLFGAPLDAQVGDDQEQVVVLPYSSGTTGLSKGVQLTHRNLVANVVQTLAVTTVDESEVSIAVLPFFHIYGMEVLMNLALRVGIKSVTMPRFDLPEFLQAHQEHGVTRSFVVPPIVVALAKHPIVDGYDLSSVRQVFSGAAPLSAELAAEVTARIGCEVVQGYGMTELSPVSHTTPQGQGKAGSVGVTIPNTETLIVSPETGERLGYDEDGEVWVRGPQVMKGYLNNPGATAATIDAEGWLHTGDIGHFDDDGHLYIVDRLKELIKYKGFQVPPAELEALLLTHPAIADAAVIGIPDEEAGEIPRGYVVLRPGQEATAEEIQQFTAEHVAHYKQIRDVVFLDAIPKSASGKILRRELRDAAGIG